MRASPVTSLARLAGLALAACHASGTVGTAASSGGDDTATATSTGSAGTGGAATSATTTGASSSSASTGGGAGGMGEPPSATPSGHLLLTAERLAELTAAASANQPGFAKLRALVDAHLGEPTDLWHDSPENLALVYLLTKESKYAQAAFAWEKSIVEGVDVRFDSYLEFGDLMRHAALVLDWCGDALDASQRALLADYLERWTEELWFDNQGSGWGLADPGNNYHHAFLQGTAYAGYALKLAGRPSAQKFLDVLNDRLGKPGGVYATLDAELAGGDWLEGANYGERSKQRLFDALAVVASMGDGNPFHDRPWFSAALRFATYQLQPDRVSLAPSGDLARDSAMPVTAAERDYLQTAAAWLGDGEARRLARWYLDVVAPPYANPYAGLAYKDLVFSVPGPATPPDGLPLGYHAAGTGFVNFRSGWDGDAASLTLSAASVVDQSHQHHDTGSFVLFRRRWLAMDAVSASASGLTWSPGAHNAIHVAGAERREGPAGSLVHLEDAGDFAYAAIDATPLYRRKSGGVEETLMHEVTRELVYLRPGTLVIYDRARPKDPARAFEWRLHVPSAPTVGSQIQVAHGGGGLTLAPLVGGALGTASDADLEGGGSKAVRVVESPTGTDARFLNALAVAAGPPPALPAARIATSDAIDGADTGAAVVVFSRASHGAPAALPFSYTVSGTAPRRHLVANLAGKVAISVAKAGGQTKVTVAPGVTHTPSAAGILSFVE